MFDPVDALEDAVAKLLASEPSGDVERMCRLAEQVEFLRLREIAAFDRSGDWAVDGFVSTASALRSRCRMAHGVAIRSIELARKLDGLAETAAAFGAGEISRHHAEIIAGAFTPERAEMIAGDEGIESQLVELARLVQPIELRNVVRQMTDAFDGDGGAGRDRAECEKNQVTLSVLGDRGVLNGSLDAESTELGLTALDAEMAALRQPGDERPAEARRAEALVSIWRKYLAAEDDNTARRHGPAHLSMVIDLTAFEADHPELVARARVEAAHVGYLSRNTLERLSCDCRISRVITDGPGQILDVGRATRTVSSALWNALVARDRHCRAPGCDRPPGYCEAHHIWHWEHGGPTNLNNLLLLCWHHHKRQHIHDAQARAG